MTGLGSRGCHWIFGIWRSTTRQTARARRREGRERERDRTTICMLDIAAAEESLPTAVAHVKMPAADETVKSITV